MKKLTFKDFELNLIRWFDAFGSSKNIKDSLIYELTNKTKEKCAEYICTGKFEELNFNPFCFEWREVLKGHKKLEIGFFYNEEDFDEIYGTDVWSVYDEEGFLNPTRYIESYVSEIYIEEDWNHADIHDHINEFKYLNSFEGHSEAFIKKGCLPKGIYCSNRNKLNSILEVLKELNLNIPLYFKSGGFEKKLFEIKFVNNKFEKRIIKSNF